MARAVQIVIGVDVSEAVSPFPRLCQASVMMGKVLSHNHQEKYESDSERFGAASELYGDVSVLARKVTEDAAHAPDYLSFTAPMALTFSTLCALCDKYMCSSNSVTNSSTETAAMQLQAIEGVKSVSSSIVEFAEKITRVTPLPQDLDRVSPLIMDALYSAAANYAWLVRESGDENSQMALESIRHCLRRLGARWRNAAEYLRILEAQEFTYAVGSAGS